MKVGVKANLVLTTKTFFFSKDWLAGSSLLP